MSLLRRIAIIAFSLALLVAACSSNPVSPGPVGIDLSAYFILPDTGFDKTFDDGTTQAWVQDSTIDGIAVADLGYTSGAHEYFRKPDRAWVATLDAAGTFFRLDPPLAALPDHMPLDSTIEARSSFVVVGGSTPVSRTSRLVDTGLTLTVPAGTFDSVIMVFQVFRIFGTTPLGQPDTTVDSAYRWFAPGLDEIQRVRWAPGQADSTLRRFESGSAGT